MTETLRDRLDDLHEKVRRERIKARFSTPRLRRWARELDDMRADAEKIRRRLDLP